MLLQGRNGLNPGLSNHESHSAEKVQCKLVYFSPVNFMNLNILEET